jgi:hypothetical protein
VKKAVWYRTYWVSERAGANIVYDSRERWYYKEPVFKRVLVQVPVYRFDSWYRTAQRIGEFRVGTSYRRNVLHTARVADDATSIACSNRQLWRRSRQDWRHGNGRTWHCTCERCRPRHHDRADRRAERMRLTALLRACDDDV